jgi:hypothetical protein
VVDTAIVEAMPIVAGMAIVVGTAIVATVSTVATAADRDLATSETRRPGTGGLLSYGFASRWIALDALSCRSLS